jgi:hypothetical protein
MTDGKPPSNAASAKLMYATRDAKAVLSDNIFSKLRA